MVVGGFRSFHVLVTTNNWDHCVCLVSSNGDQFCYCRSRQIPYTNYYSFIRRGYY